MSDLYSNVVLMKLRVVKILLECGLSLLIG